MWRYLLTTLKWAVLAVVALEIFSFVLVSGSNYLIYGHLREGSRVRYDPYALFLNVDGPRPTAHNPPPPAAGRCRTLWLLGGSTMRGSTNHDNRTIPSYLAAALNGPGPFRVVVHNFGENSFNSLMETKYLQKLLIEDSAPPDVIIFYDGANDCTYFAQHQDPYGHYAYRRLRALVESYHQSFFGLLKPLNAALYSSFTKELYDKIRQTVVPLNPDSPSLERLAAMTAQRYRYVRKLAGCYGARFLLVWQPILWVETGKVNPRVQEQERQLAIFGEQFLAVRHNFAVTYQALARRLQGQPYFVDFQNVLCSRREPVYKPDGVHLNDAGRELVAQALSRVLEERGLVPSR
jgi:lysophospholipase L1-like esterase